MALDRAPGPYRVRRMSDRGLSGAHRALLVLVAALGLAAAFLVARSGGEDGARPPAATQPRTTTATTATGGEPTSRPAPTPAPPPAFRTIRVVGGRPQGGVRTLTYEKGDEVRIRVRSDVADEVHVHGYDVTRTVPAGGSVRLRFDADIEGRFEIELHQAHVQLATLEVTPR